MPMVSVTLLFAALFVALGVGGWTLTGMESPTALIPAGFGVVFGVLAMLARKESIRKHIMHAAAMLALLGFAGSVRGLMALPGLLSGGEVENLRLHPGDVRGLMDVLPKVSIGRVGR